MAVPKGVEWLAPLLASLNIAISVPLVLGKIPPNRFYGFRTRKTLGNERIWYQANYTGGQNLMVASVIALVGIVATALNLDRSIALPIELVIVLAATLISVAVSLVQIAKM